VKIAIGILLVAGISCLHASSLLLDGSFENPPVPAGSLTQYATGSNIGGAWTVTGTICGTSCVLAINTTYSEQSGAITFEAEDGSVALDLTGSGNTVDGGVQQIAATLIGMRYNLSFWVGNADNTKPGYGQNSAVQLVVNNLPVNVYTNSNNTSGIVNWEQFVYSFVASTSSTTVKFVNATIGDNEAGLDNVSLDLATPEPATLFFGGFAMIAAAAVLRRQTRRQ